jgi:hypothetical protein
MSIGDRLRIQNKVMWFAWLGFFLPHIIYIFGGGNWRPRDLWIFFVIWFGFDMLIYLYYYIYFFTKGLPQVLAELGDGASEGTYKRFCSYTMIKVVNYLTIAIVIGIWLWNTKGNVGSELNVSYLHGDKSGRTPNTPLKSAGGFFPFMQICTIVIFLFGVDTIYNLLLTRDLEEIHALNKVSALHSRAGTTDEQKKVDRASRSRLRMDIVKPARGKAHASDEGGSSDEEQEGGSSRVELAAVPKSGGTAVNVEDSRHHGIYYFFAGVLYFVGFVYCAIMFAQWFQNSIPMSLTGVFVLLVIMTAAAILMWVFFYVGTVSMRDYVRSIGAGTEHTAGVGMELEYTLIGGHMFWVFLLVINWLGFAFFFAQQGDDKVSWHTVPRLNVFVPSDVPPFVQKNAWYVWDILTIYNTVAIPLLVLHVIAVLYTTERGIKGITKEEANRMRVAQIKVAQPRVILILVAVLFWLAFLVVWTFSFSAILGNTWLGVSYRGYIISFIIIGFVAVALILTSTKVRMTRVVSSELDKYVNHMMTLSSMRVLYVLPVYFAIAVLVYWVTYGKYSQTFHTHRIEAVVRLPATAPIDPLVYYWPKINTTELLLSIVLLIVLVEFNSSISVKLLKFPASKREKT